MESAMRKFQKTQILEIITNLHALHQECEKKIAQKDYKTVQTALVDAQEAAIQIGGVIEEAEGAGTEAVAYLEQYCESIYRISMQAEEITPQKVCKMLEKNLIKAENAVRHLQDTIEVVFLPYKASMWDSLESVWKAADADPNCDAYVIPIPYYEKNADGSLSIEHDEREEYPADVPVIDYRGYDFAKRRPDAVFIHNPYDQYNNVTTIHPFFYAKNLKQFTNLLVYIPYYATSGGMSEAQSQCIVYYYADYIVIQAEKYRNFFDPELPDEKFLPLGSPKFDRIIHICKNPPEPPAAWKAKMSGKKVYFYNTSIGGMLANTASFLKKMEYVFSCFADRQDACLIWRPHPLLESTFGSMRPEYKAVYEALKKYFIVSGFGIYDDTPELANTIAHCDAYIGDSGSSVVSMFGIAGKPIFLLNNEIHSLPEKDDWRGEVIKSLIPYYSDEWMITQGNKLYHASECGNKYTYEYYCDLSDYANGDYYCFAVSIQDKNYVCPMNAQDIPVIGNGKMEKKIALERRMESGGAFCGAVGCDEYLFLIPNYYPAIVRYNTINGEIDYFGENLDVFIKMVQGERRIGGFCVQDGCLYLASPADNQVLVIHAKTGQSKVMAVNTGQSCGCSYLCSDETDLWFLPYFGNVIIRWNPGTGEVHEYADYPQGMECRNPRTGQICMEIPFLYAAFYDNDVYFLPFWGNMYIKLDKISGKTTEWEPPFEQLPNYKNGYYTYVGKSYLIRTIENTDGKVYRIGSGYDRKIYDVNFATKEYKEVPIEFSMEELRQNEPGFREYSEWMAYVCQENAFHSLPDFLDGNIIGNPFNKEQAVHAYEKIAANNDGTSGMKIYDFIRNKLLAQ